MSNANSHPPGKRPRRARLVNISVSGVSPVLLAKLKRRATSDRRTLSNTVNLILEKAVQEQEARLNGTLAGDHSQAA